MAGRGPQPKDPSKRVRHSTDANVPSTTIRFVPGEQPELPDMPEGFEWHERTHSWWRMWGESPQAEHFMASDWDFLMDTAILHTRFWNGEMSVGPELRLRVAKFGQTPEDRARLRMQFADADDKDRRAGKRAPSEERYGDLRVIPTPGAETG